MIMASIDRFREIFGPVRRAALADPETDAERPFTPELWVFATDNFTSGDQGGGALKLLQGQQAQRIAHEHGDARHAIKPAEIPLQAPHRHTVGGEPEIGFRLATAGREPEQIGIRFSPLRSE